ncbi:MAG: hypothetical protein ACLU30_15975 [Odoribacter splanchnicus]
MTLAGSYSRSNTLQENWWAKTHCVARYKNAEYEEAALKTADGHCLLPYGGILNTTQTMTESYTLRTQLDYRLLLEKIQHMFSAMGGFEMNGNVTKQNSTRFSGI